MRFIHFTKNDKTEEGIKIQYHKQYEQITGRNTRENGPKYDKKLGGLDKNTEHQTFLRRKGVVHW